MTYYQSRLEIKGKTTVLAKGHLSSGAHFFDLQVGLQIEHCLAKGALKPQFRL